MIILLLSLIALSFIESNHLSVRLESNWDDRDLLLEVGEFFGQSNNKDFWSLLDYSLSSSSTQTLLNATDYDVFEWAKVAARQLLGPIQARSLEVTLAMGTNAPALAAARDKQPAHDCAPFVLLNGDAICDPADIPANPKYYAEHHEFIYPGDHSWAEHVQGIPTAVLYGTLGSEQTAKFHTSLTQLFPRANYIFRHSPKPASTPRKFNLPGYSLVLSIKNTEYKTVDDANIEGDDCVDRGHVGSDFDLDQLRKFSTNYSEADLRQALSKTPKVKIPRRFGLTLLSYVIEAKDQLAALTVVSTMLPSLQNVISGISVSTRATQLERAIAVQRFHNEIPENVLYVNSRLFDLGDSNLFKLGQLLSQESRLLDGLHALGFSTAEIGILSTLSADEEEGRLAVDYRKWGTLQYWNDLERGHHPKWHLSVGQMLRYAPYYGIQPISLNFLTFVFVVKPSDPVVTVMLDLCQQIISDEIAVRFSFLFFTDDQSRSLDARIWHEFRTKMTRNSREAWKFLREVDSSKLGDSDAESNRTLELSTEYAKGAGLSAFPGILINGVPHPEGEISQGQLRKLVIDSMKQNVNALARDYYNGDYEEGDDAADYSIGKNVVFDRLNPSFLNPRGSRSFLDLTKIENHRLLLSSIPYVSKMSSKPVHTTWLVADFDFAETAVTAKTISSHYSNKKYRLALIHTNISTAGQFCREFYVHSAEDCLSFAENHLRSLLNALPGTGPRLVVDGKVYEYDLLLDQDLRLLDHVSTKGIPLSKMGHINNDDIFAAKSLVDQFAISKTDLSTFDDIRAFSLVPHGDDPFLSLQMFVNPFAFEAHQLVAIVRELTVLYNARLDVYITPMAADSDQYWGYAFQSTLTFDDQGALSDGPSAQIGHLPTGTLLSASVSTIHNWMVSPSRTPHDLDNIVFSEAIGGICAVYRLDYIIVEGHCYDSVLNEFPAGLQLYLDNGQSQQFGTTVMRNIGYFQLKANPGVWWLTSGTNPAGDGYSIKSVTGSEGSLKGARMLIMVDSFHTEIITVEVAKVAETRTQTDIGLFSNLFGYFSRWPGRPSPTSEVVNVFSLASGHLYERLLKVMMLSVINHTSSPIKFYFLKNFLSPSFKDFLPAFSRQYGFDYVLVEYVWPHWLRRQTVRQRVIWGYKILFLDVLFPLDVSRVIYLDADQTIRTDIKELFRTDLQGAPYGFTPFCDNRPEMDSYRFWKSPYWTTLLGGRPYHISALFVVDLVAFRRLSAGDILREQYHMLTADPGNLANLDQDLPNSLIKHIPMFSLDKSWLWCETWCSAESKVLAKTIDLCNNPRTKESKLHSAFRIVPEWRLYDEEIQNFTKISSQQVTRVDDEL